MSKPDFVDHMMKQDKAWRAGLPWSRFGAPLVLLGVLLLMVSLWRAEDWAPWRVAGVLLMGAGVLCLYKARRVSDARAAEKKRTRG